MSLSYPQPANKRPPSTSVPLCTDRTCTVCLNPIAFRFALGKYFSAMCLKPYIHSRSSVQPITQHEITDGTVRFPSSTIKWKTQKIVNGALETRSRTDRSHRLPLAGSGNLCINNGWLRLRQCAAYITTEGNGGILSLKWRRLRFSSVIWCKGDWK